MNIELLSIQRTKEWDFRRDMAQVYGNALRNAIVLHVNGADERKQKQRGYFVSQKRGLEDKLYVGNIHRIEHHLYWNDEELSDDDQIVNVVMIDGPVTRDGGACSYGTKDFRDQVLYANTIPQVVGHLFYINTPGGESHCRVDYEMMIADCREKGKATVAFVDGMCCSSGVNLASRCDRVVVMNPGDEFGCIGSMAAFWATPDGAIDRDGSRWVEIVGDNCPAKNDWWREAAQGEYDKLKSQLNKSTDEFHKSVRESRPLVKDWMLTGEVFEAKDVIPALVDEIGDYNRAIECVFQLADQTLPAARFAVAEPEEESAGNPAPEGDEQQEMAKLNEQQKAAVNTSRGDLMIADNGHVKTDVQGFFGPETIEIAKPQNDNDMDMEDEEKKGTEAESAQDTNQETVEQPTEQEISEQGAVEETGEGAGEDKVKQQASEQAVSDETEENADDHTVDAKEDNQAEIDRLTELLHNAEAQVEKQEKMIAALNDEIADKAAVIDKSDKMIAEQDKDIDTLTKEVDEKDKAIAELKAANEKLTKQVVDLKAEVKELSEKPTPMVDAQAGVPADNGTGEAPKENQHQRIKRGMTYEEIREVMKNDCP